MGLSAFVDRFFRSLMILPSLFRYPSLLRTTLMSSSESASTLDLLDENIFDILSRLPVKSLLRFKCVSKPWYSLISDPRFIRAHLLQQRKMKSKILFCTQDHTLIMDYEDCDNPIVKLDFPVGYRLDEKCVEFVGSCDGLVCLLVDHNTFILWNPSTREEWQLPPPYQWSIESYQHFFGFGYDSSIDDYKLVSGLCREVVGDNVDPVFDCIVNVFTLNSREWKWINFGNFGYHWYGLGIFGNGNLSWLSKFSEPNNVVLSFNMKEEKFMGVIPLPEDCDLSSYELSLAASENSLFISIPDCQCSPHFTVWKKSADVVEDSWKKLCHCSFDFLPRLESPSYQLCITGYHKRLLRYSVNSISTIDLEARTRKDFPVTSRMLEGIDYLESLVSLN